MTPEEVAEILGDDGMSNCPTPMCSGSYGWEPIEYEGAPHWHTHCGCGWLNDFVPESHLIARQHPDLTP